MDQETQLQEKQLPKLTPIPVESRRNLWKYLAIGFGLILVLIAFIFVILKFAVIGGVFTLGSNNDSLVLPTPTTTFSTTPLTIQDITINIPPSWWYEHGKNESFPIEWYDINPVAINKTTEIANFTLRVDKETILIDKKIDELIKTWHLVNVQRIDLTVPNNKGIQIIGVADPNYEHNNSRFQENDKVAITVFSKTGYTYQLIGLLSKYNDEYFELAKSISFKESNVYQTEPTNVMLFTIVSQYKTELLKGINAVDLKYNNVKNIGKDLYIVEFSYVQQDGAILNSGGGYVLVGKVDGKWTVPLGAGNALFCKWVGESNLPEVDKDYLIANNACQ